jgi:dipeptide/tripeptide permease
LSFAQRFHEIRTGFEPAFWVANFTEIFERVAYYATTAVLAIYLSDQLHFSNELALSVTGTFGLVVWFLPILGGTLADRLGFRRALMFAYLVMTVGYFLLGSLSATWMEPLRHALGEILLSSRYYDYISRLAPSGQEGLYMGYAFLPIAIGYKAGGWLGGYLLHHFGEIEGKPQRMWFVVTAIGVFATFLMWIYDKTVKLPAVAEGKS